MAEVEFGIRAKTHFSTQLNRHFRREHVELNAVLAGLQPAKRDLQLHPEMDSKTRSVYAKLAVMMAMVMAR